jgi:hypothetical protein
VTPALRCTRFTSRSEAGSLKLSLPSLEDQLTVPSGRASPCGGFFTPTRARGSKSPFPFGDSKTPSPCCEEERSPSSSGGGGFYPRLRHRGAAAASARTTPTNSKCDGGSPEMNGPTNDRESVGLRPSSALETSPPLARAGRHSPAAAVGEGSPPDSPSFTLLLDSSGSDNDSGKPLKHHHTA